jgi:hypothetical protein
MGTTNGKRNKNAGHSWEREIVNDLKEMGYPHVVTTRSESRGRDAQKIDVMNKDEGENGRLPYNIQAKSLSKTAPYPKLLAELPIVKNVINVIFHKQTKANDSGRFMTQGKFAILSLTDFYQMIKDRLRLNKLEEGFKEMLKYIDFIPDEERRELDGKLSTLGL